MADDQATLGSFADEGTDGSGDGADGRDAGTQDLASGPENRDADASDERVAEATARAAGDADELVCPWCLASDDRFVGEGPTGLACGRCSAALPADADWFRGREVVARRPMYEAED